MAGTPERTQCGVVVLLHFCGVYISLVGLMFLGYSLCLLWTCWGGWGCGCAAGMLGVYCLVVAVRWVSRAWVKHLSLFTHFVYVKLGQFICVFYGWVFGLSALWSARLRFRCYLRSVFRCSLGLVWGCCYLLWLRVRYFSM